MVSLSSPFSIQKNSPKVSQTACFPLCSHSHSSFPVKTDKKKHSADLSQKSNFLCDSPTFPRSVHRCFQPRMGVSHFHRNSKQGILACKICKSPHQRSGNYCGLSCPKKDQSSSVFYHQTFLGQQGSSSHSVKGRFGKVPSTQFLDGLYCHTTCSTKSFFGTKPHSRPTEFYCRCSFSSEPNSHRMDFRQEQLSTHSAPFSTSASGSLCYSPQSSTSNVCVSPSRSSSHSSGCHGSRLEQVAINLSIPSCQPSTSGSCKIKILQGSSSSSSPRMEKIPLVPSSAESMLEIPSAQPSSFPKSFEQDFLRAIRSHETPSRLNLLRSSLLKSWSPDIVDLLLSDVRDSTLHQYQSVFSTFVKYLKSENVSSISADSILKFFSYCFYSRKRAPSTLMSYKSALSPVFSQVFGIHIDDKIYESLFRSFRLKRPNKPLHNSVDWDLDAVLKFIVSFPRTLSVHDLMSKGAFLLFLVSAGRCSEIAALSRHHSHIKKLLITCIIEVPLGKRNLIRKMKTAVAKNIIFI